MKYDIDKLRRATYLIIGVGNLGTRVLENLARIPHKKIILIDHDLVGPENVGYQEIYHPEDIGGEKVYRAKRRIEEKYPWARIEANHGSIPDAVEDTGDEISTKILEKQFKFLDANISRSDIVFITLDAASARLSAWLVSMRKDKPFIDVGYQENFGNIFLWMKGYPCPLCFISGLKIKYDRTYYADPILVEIVTALASKMAVDYVDGRITNAMKIEVYNYKVLISKVAEMKCIHYEEVKNGNYIDVMRKIYLKKFR